MKLAPCQMALSDEMEKATVIPITNFNASHPSQYGRNFCMHPYPLLITVVMSILSSAPNICSSVIDVLVPENLMSFCRVVMNGPREPVAALSFLIFGAEGLKRSGEEGRTRTLFLLIFVRRVLFSEIGKVHRGSACLMIACLFYVVYVPPAPLVRRGIKCFINLPLISVYLFLSACHSNLNPPAKSCLPV